VALPERSQHTSGGSTRGPATATIEAPLFGSCSRIARGIRRRRRRSQRKNASAHSSSVRRRAIPDARSWFFGSCSRIALCLIARSARGDVRWVAAVFVGSDGTEKRCSAISSCRSAARTSRIRRRRRRSQLIRPPITRNSSLVEFC
jgi:hypothetical protein